MSWVGDFIDDIVDSVCDIADDIWDAINQMANWVEEQVGWINTALIVLTVVAVAIMLPVAIAAYEGAMLTATIASTETLTGFSLVYAQTISSAIGLQAGFAAFLEAIYFDVILSVHNIAYLISPQYRDIFQKVLNEIMQISEVLGLGPSFMVLALENARTLVLTVSGMFGMKYDLAQVQWLAIMNDFLKEFAAKANRYKNNPGLLLLDMGEMINRPVMDQMGEYWQTIIKTVDDIITNAGELAKVLTDISRDLDAFIQDLPESIKKQITPITDPIIRNFNDFVRLEFKPTINIINGVIDVLEVKQTAIKSTVDDTVQRLLYPDRYLHEIDEFGGGTQIDSEYGLSEVTNRPQREFFDEVDIEGETIKTDLEIILEDLAVKLPKPKWRPKPLPISAVKHKIKLPPRLSWFVEDY